MVVRLMKNQCVLLLIQLPIKESKIITKTSFQGSLRLGTSSATHIYVNPPIKETDTLLDRYHPKNNTL